MQCHVPCWQDDVGLKGMLLNKEASWPDINLDNIGKSVPSSLNVSSYHHTETR